MMQHLTEHQALPASQVIHTQTRNTIGAVLQETRLEDLPSISHRPKFPIELQRSNRISRLVIPD